MLVWRKNRPLGVFLPRTWTPYVVATSGGAMFVVELSLKLSPMPISVQRKELSAATALYEDIKRAMESGQPRLLELSCEKAEEKRIAVLSSEVLGVQMYEKSAMGAGSKRPGFSIEG